MVTLGGRSFLKCDIVYIVILLVNLINYKIQFNYRFFIFFAINHSSRQCADLGTCFFILK